MNRIDRLTAILLLLQTGKRSAAEIAQHFEVSRRTIQRDIDAFCEMGIDEVQSEFVFSILLDQFQKPANSSTERGKIHDRT